MAQRDGSFRRASLARGWLLLAAAICVGAGAAAAQAPAAAPAAQLPPVTPTNVVDSGAVLDRMSAREVQLWNRLKELTPRIETYLQNLDTSIDLGAQPIADRYYLGILHFGSPVRVESFLPDPQQAWRRFIGPIDDTLLQPARYAVELDVSPTTFARMLFPDPRGFDRAHYRFNYVRREFLGQVRCYVFDVAPADTHARGAFFGRIWIEDQDDVLVRFNGTFWQDRYGHPDLHFDSWRMNVRPGIWAPAYVYSEESHMPYGFFRHARLQAQTRLWGYDLRYAGHQEQLTTVTVEGAEVKPPEAPATLSPVSNARDWEHEAEDNVLDRLERAGLLAPAGPVDDVLGQVVSNLVITNKLDISPPVRCRVLITTPLESLAIGHTIVLSRGLIDSLPDESGLAAILAHELAHISLGQRLDTRYAFGDRLLFPDRDSFQILNLKRSPEEERRANDLALKLLENSPYRAQLREAGLYLRQIDARRTQEPHLFSPHLGNSWFAGDYLVRLHALLLNAPPLQPMAVSQTAAKPLGGRLLVDPWSGAVVLEPDAPVKLLSAQEKMPLQIAPIIPYLQRTTAGEAAPPGGKR